MSNDITGKAASVMGIVNDRVSEFPESVQRAIALSDHFRDITPDEYVLPMNSVFRPREADVPTQGLEAYTYSPL
jgi:hypothetical protein